MKKSLLCLILLLIFIFNRGFAQTFRVLPGSRDYWYSTQGVRGISRHDKVIHFFVAGSMSIYDWKWALGLSLAWEIKDGFIPDEKYGWIGGDGFSLKDMIANVAGIVAGHYLKKGVKWIYKKWR